MAKIPQVPNLAVVALDGHVGTKTLLTEICHKFNISSVFLDSI